MWNNLALGLLLKVFYEEHQKWQNESCFHKMPFAGWDSSRDGRLFPHATVCSEHTAGARTFPKSPLPQTSGALNLQQACKHERRSPVLEELWAIAVVLKELYLSIRNWNKQLQWDLIGKSPLENRIAGNSCLNLITEKASKLMGWNTVRTRGKDVLSPGKEKSVLQGCERNTTSRIKKGVLHY